MSMHPIRLTLSMAVSAAACVHGVEHLNQTEVRERDGVIASSYYDLRLDGPTTRSGLPPQWPDAIFTVAATTSQWTWGKSSILASPPGSPVTAEKTSPTEKRQDLELDYRQSLWTPWPWDAALEVRATGTQRTFDNGAGINEKETLLGDPIVMLDVPLWQDRYSGFMLGIGATVPVGNEADWMNAHGKSAIVGSARWTTLVPGLSMTSFTASVEGQQLSGAQQRLYTSDQKQLITCDFTRIDAGLELTWRPADILAVSGALGYESRRWSSIEVPGFSVNPDESVDRTSVIAALRIMAPRRCFWTLWGGYAGEAMAGLKFQSALW